MAAPVEKKVTAASVAAYLASTAITFVSGWAARHTPRGPAGA